MKMKFNIPSALGLIIGWFIISPMLPPIVKLTPIEILQKGILGLLLAIFIGLFFGTIEDYYEAKLEHAKLMKEYFKLKKEINEHERQLKTNKQK